MAVNEMARTMTTFSGSDIKAYFDEIEIGNIQGISISVNREVRPVFVMGSPDPISYSRGKRGIAGSLILTTFDRDALYEMKKKKKFFRKYTDVNMQDRDADNFLIAEANTFGGEWGQPKYSDQLPPFDITLIGFNEAGVGAVMRIHGVHLVSEGTGLSIDDNVAENQFTFVAQSVDWWQNIPTLQEGQSYSGNLADVGLEGISGFGELYFSNITRP